MKYIISIALLFTFFIGFSQSVFIERVSGLDIKERHLEHPTNKGFEVFTYSIYDGEKLIANIFPENGDKVAAFAKAKKFAIRHSDNRVKGLSVNRAFITRRKD